MGQARPADQSREYRKGRVRRVAIFSLPFRYRGLSSQPFPHMSARQPPRQPTKTGGAMNLVMPLYTMGVVVFFLYTVLKLACKKPQESLQTDVAGPQGPDRYPQDLRLAYSSRQIPKSAGPGNWDGTVNSPAQPSDPEVEQLKKRLEDTEALLRQLLLQQARPPGMVGSPQLSPTVGQSLSLLVKELSKQCRQEEPHVETESPSRLAASSNRDQGGLRRRAHKTQRTCSCGAPLDMPPGTKDLQSDSDTSDWAKDSGDEDAATFMAANGKHYSECR